MRRIARPKWRRRLQKHRLSRLRGDEARRRRKSGRRPLRFAGVISISVGRPVTCRARRADNLEMLRCCLKAFYVTSSRNQAPLREIENIRHVSQYNNNQASCSSCSVVACVWLISRGCVESAHISSRNLVSATRGLVNEVISKVASQAACQASGILPFIDAFGALDIIAGAMACAYIKFGGSGAVRG